MLGIAKTMQHARSQFTRGNMSQQHILGHVPATFSCVCKCCDFVPATCPRYLSLLRVASVCTKQARGWVSEGVFVFMWSFCNGGECLLLRKFQGLSSSLRKRSISSQCFVVFPFSRCVVQCSGTYDWQEIGIPAQPSLNGHLGQFALNRGWTQYLANPTVRGSLRRIWPEMAGKQSDLLRRNRTTSSKLFYTRSIWPRTRSYASVYTIV